MKKIEQLSITNKVAEIIREEILKGSLKTGDRLHEIDLCEKLGISRTPLREAIGILEAEGLVERIPQKGCRVVSFTIQDVENIYELRINLEGLATEKSVPKLTAQNIRELEEIQLNLRRAVEQHEWYLVDTLNQEFHRKLFSKGSNDRLIKLAKNLNQVGRLIRVSAFAIPGRSLRVLEEHEVILDAVKNGDKDLARELIEDHLQAAKDTLLTYLAKDEE